jgi:broad specificity phosphatase PhoE
MSTVYLIRHGQACFGTDDYDRLSGDGALQVRHLRAHFDASGETLHAIFSGALRRQRETAAILADGTGLGVSQRAEFNEYDADAILRRHASPASTASHDARSFQRWLESASLAWVDGALDGPDIESWQAFRARVARGLEELMKSEGRARRFAVCTSAGVIGAAVGHVLGLGDHGALKLSWSIHNASITRLHYDGDRVSLHSFNAVPHLERAELRSLLTYR